MKYKAVIFDLDGVICCTDEYHYIAWKQVADARNIYFDKEINNRLRGVSRMESLNIILERSIVEYTNDEKEAIAEEKNNIYKKLLGNMNENDVEEGVIETLNALRQNGVKLAIGSSSKNTRYILERIGLSDAFDAISDGTNIVNSKPDPEVFLKAAEFVGEAPENCLVVEDAFAGIEAAKRGGFDSAGIKDAKDSPDSTYKLNKISDLLNI